MTPANTSGPADKSEGKTRGQSEGRLWPIPVFPLVMVLIAIVLLEPARFWLGTSPNPNVDRAGTAQIESCERDWTYLNLVRACAAQVRWTKDLTTLTPNALDGKPVEETVYTLEPLSGTVDVVDRCGSRDDQCVAVPADHPNRSGLGFLPVLVVIAFGVIGLFFGLRLAGKRKSPPKTTETD